MKNPGQEFRQFALHNQHIGTLHTDAYLNRFAGSIPKAITPYIIEERPLHMTQMDVFSRLMMDRIIFVGEEVHDQMANIIQAQLLFLQSLDSKRPIHLYINSPGGSVYAGLGIYDTMQYVTPEISTTCTGVALSFGAILLCAGAAGKRSALPHARVMLHQPSAGTKGQVSDMEIAVREFLKLKEELYDIVAHHTNQTKEKVTEVSDRDYWMTAAEAKEFGMIDEILAARK
jgi:ATP-dependent Clp protease, protease subunit